MIDSVDAEDFVVMACVVFFLSVSTSAFLYYSNLRHSVVKEHSY